MKPDKFWDEQHHKYADKDWIDKPSLFAETAIRYFPKTGKILELGAGHGQNARFFANFGYKVEATDFSDVALRYAKSKANSDLITFEKLDMSDGMLPYEDGEFEVVFAHLSLHYFTDAITDKLFEETRRVLKKDGIFAAFFNTVEDPEIPNLEKIDKNYYFEAKTGLRKRYFDLDYLNKITSGRFIPIIADNKGETYKDKINCLIRFVGKKK